jgi:hypothetical protein
MEIEQEIVKRLPTHARINAIKLVDGVAEGVDADRGDVTAVVFHMLWHRKIQCDLEELIIQFGRLSHNMTVWRQGKDDE